MDEHEKSTFPLNDLEFEKIAINSGWLKEIWGKWLGDETIEELLAALKGPRACLKGQAPRVERVAL